MENNTKRALSVIFAFLLLMSIFPAAAFANGSAQNGETLVAVSIEAVADFEQSEASRNGGAETWALMNVILCVVTFLAAIAALRIRDGRIRTIAILAAAAALVTTAVTQDFGAHIILADKWTALMAVYAAGCSALNEMRSSKKPRE